MTIVLIAVFAYLSATALLVRAVSRDDDQSMSALWLWPAIAAVAAHGGYHLLAWRAAGGADMHFFAALSLVGLGMATLTAQTAELLHQVEVVRVEQDRIIVPARAAFNATLVFTP